MTNIFILYTATWPNRFWMKGRTKREFWSFANLPLRNRLFNHTAIYLNFKIGCRPTANEKKEKQLCNRTFFINQIRSISKTWNMHQKVAIENQVCCGRHLCMFECRFWCDNLHCIYIYKNRIHMAIKCNMHWRWSTRSTIVRKLPTRKQVQNGEWWSVCLSRIGLSKTKTAGILHATATIARWLEKSATMASHQAVSVALQ